MIPGSNILKQALSIIASQTVAYSATNGRAVNAVGQYVATYSAPVNVKGSLQPIPRELYQKYGLDFSKQYVTFYASSNIKGIGRGTAGDKLQYQNELYQVEATNPWFNIDGWLSVICVRINP